MSGAWWSKTLMVIAAVAVSILCLIPTVFLLTTDDESVDPGNHETWPSAIAGIYDAMGSAHITPGLDLQGGLHLQYQVDVDKAISDKVDRYVDDMRRSIERDHPDAVFEVERIDGAPALRVTSTGIPALDLLDTDTLGVMNLLPAVENSNSVRLEVDSDFIEELKGFAIDQAIATISARVDEMGTLDPSINRRGDSDIIIQLPGLGADQFDQLKALIEQTAQLEFKMVSESDGGFFQTATVADFEGSTRVGGRLQAASLEQLRTAYAAVTTPPDTIIAYEDVRSPNAQTGELERVGYRPILLEAETQLTGEYINDARTGTDPQTNQPVVSMSFDSEGASLFGRLTSAVVGRRMAIVLDEVVASAPTINEPILGGSAQITMGGGGTYNEGLMEAQQLSIVLRNGALPAPIEKQFETQVGPSLGADSIRSGQLSLLIAFSIVFVFIIFYYKTSGVIASVALALNVLFILGILSILQATLTLPGIAGIILTIGMAVDANVIIFERIKEELRGGKAARQAIDIGFEKAKSAVL
ncbi:MAG: preprotein translocase subunit SecD, partial [Bradymonadia bacterium]